MYLFFLSLRVQFYEVRRFVQRSTCHLHRFVMNFQPPKKHTVEPLTKGIKAIKVRFMKPSIHPVAQHFVFDPEITWSRHSSSIKINLVPV